MRINKALKTALPKQIKEISLWGQTFVRIRLWGDYLNSRDLCGMPMRTKLIIGINYFRLTYGWVKVKYRYVTFKTGYIYNKVLGQN